MSSGMLYVPQGSVQSTLLLLLYGGFMGPVTSCDHKARHRNESNRNDKDFFLIFTCICFDT